MKSQRQQTSRSKWNQILFFNHVLLRVWHTFMQLRELGRKMFDFKELSKICPSTFHPSRRKNGATSTKDSSSKKTYFHLSTLVSQKWGKREFHQNCKEGWLGDVANGLHVSLPLISAVMPGSNQSVMVTNPAGTLEMSTQLFWSLNYIELQFNWSVIMKETLASCTNRVSTLI